MSRPQQPAAPIVGDATDPAQIKRGRDFERLRRERELNDIGKVLATAEGRRLFYRLFDVAGIFRSSFTGNSTTFFNEGQRQVGLVFLADLNDHFPERYLEMLREAKERAETGTP